MFHVEHLPHLCHLLFESSMVAASLCAPRTSHSRGSCHRFDEEAAKRRVCHLCLIAICLLEENLQSCRRIGLDSTRQALKNTNRVAIQKGTRHATFSDSSQRNFVASCQAVLRPNEDCVNSESSFASITCKEVEGLKSGHNQEMAQYVLSHSSRKRQWQVCAVQRFSHLYLITNSKISWRRRYVYSNHDDSKR